jgi:hypothetical protein
MEHALKIHQQLIDQIKRFRRNKKPLIINDNEVQLKRP